MGTISAKKVDAALAKARNVCIVEEPFTLGDCAVVLRNLRPDQYTAVLHECQGLPDAEYLISYYRGHLARSIVELNGLDLRDVDFVEVEEPDPTDSLKAKAVKLELHSYLDRSILSTWSRTAIFTAYRKFGDVEQLADKKGKEGIHFLTPEETPEEKFRRLLGELKEVEQEVPEAILDDVLEDAGYMRRSTADEIKAVMEQTAKLAREEEEKQRVVQAPLPPTPSAAPLPPGPSPDELMARRQPLNRPMPVDPHQTLQQAVAARTAPQQAQQMAQPEPVAMGRAARIAALEAEAGDGVPTMLGPGGQKIPLAELPSKEVAELSKKGAEQIDPKALSGSIDRPPTAGLNPRFKPPPRA